MLTVLWQAGGQWLDAALRSLPTQRADGVVTVTEHQIIRFQNVVRSPSRTLTHRIFRIDNEVRCEGAHLLCDALSRQG